MLTIICVLKAGGIYTADWVARLQRAVERNLSIEHRFVCLSDVNVPCERIRLKHRWQGWFSKIEIFRPDVITGPTLYLDLDTCITGPLDSVTTIPFDFAMLSIRDKGQKNGDSGAMWFAKPFPHVYEKFAKSPEHWMKFHKDNARGKYLGDQAFISDCFDEIPKLHQWNPDFFKSYRFDGCQERVPDGCSVVCFGGPARPHTSGGWVKGAWV